jgi:hypothetical protein
MRLLILVAVLLLGVGCDRQSPVQQGSSNEGKAAQSAAGGSTNEGKAARSAGR